MRELKALAKADGKGELKVFGLGGDRLAEEGAELLMHNRAFSVMGGPLEVISKIPLRRKLELALERELFAGRVPKLAILVDSGEINLRLASLLHFFGVPIVYFIPPKVWVWRHSRIEKIEQHVDLVLSILPFEEPIYRNWEIPFEYVGNPLLDELELAMSAAEARTKLGIDQERDVLAVFVGSRHSEVRHHSELFGQAVRRFIESLPQSAPKPLVLLPAAQAIEPELLTKSFEPWLKGTGAELKVVKGMSHECLCASRAALVKSGTSTLEAALFGAPMVLAYQSSKSSEWIYKHVVRYRGFVGLVNLFLARDAEAALGWGKPEQPVVPELILERCTPEQIAAALGEVYIEGPGRAQMKEQLARTRQLLQAPNESSPVRAAARACWRLSQQGPRARVEAAL